MVVTDVELVIGSGNELRIEADLNRCQELTVLVGMHYAISLLTNWGTFW